MQYKGHIEHGTVVLEDAVDLSDGTPVKGAAVPDVSRHLLKMKVDGGFATVQARTPALPALTAFLF